MRLDIRSTYLLGCIATILAIVAFMYLRILMLDAIPCPLCVFEFLCLILSGLFLLILTWFYPSEKVHCWASALVIFFNVVGVCLSARHFFLTKFLSGAPFCFSNQEELRSAMSSNLVGTFVDAFQSGICQGGRVLFGVNISVILLASFVAGLAFILIQVCRVRKHGMLG